MSAELTLDENVLSKWVGQCEEKKDKIDARPANFLKATLNQEGREFRHGDPLPYGWHWIYFLEAARMDQLGRDGHAALGEFLPPVALPKRMWAGAKIKFHSPVIIGDEMVKTSVVKNISRKSGSSGELCFVTVNHRFFSGSVLKLEEDHNIVYREDKKQKGATKSPFKAPTEFDDSLEVNPTSTLLFRYSALTFNGHRIHYDLDFCQNIENYPGLVVHAPLTATFMLGLATRYYLKDRVDPQFDQIEFKALSPLFSSNSYTVNLKDLGDRYELWAANPEGNLAMNASLTLA